MSELHREEDQAVDYLDDVEEQDNLPEIPPDYQSRATEWGTTASEQRTEETIDQRIAQEEPDPDSAYGAPRNESGMDFDNSAEIATEDDYLGSGEVMTDADLDADSSAERSAMHVETDGGEGDGDDEDLV